MPSLLETSNDRSATEAGTTSQEQGIPHLDCNGHTFTDTVCGLREQIRFLHTVVDNLVAVHEIEVQRAADFAGGQVPFLQQESRKESSQVDTAESRKDSSQAAIPAGILRPPSKKYSSTSASFDIDILSTPNASKTLETGSSLNRPSEKSLKFHASTSDTETLLYGTETVLVDIDSSECISSALASQQKVFAQGSDSAVRRLIDSSWDPNYRFHNTMVKNKLFLHVTPLACAVLRNRVDLVHWLVSASANPDSDYSFTAGAAGMVWTGACSHAAIPSGNLVVLKELFNLRCDVNSRGSNDANLLWQAAYFNQKEIADYLIKSKCDIEKKGRSQDRSHAWYTPLHTAAFYGHAELVSCLLRGNASVAVHDQACESTEGSDDGAISGNSVLRDAIAQGHPDVAKLLIEYSADLFEVTPSPYHGKEKASVASIGGRASDATKDRKELFVAKPGVRLLDVILGLNNPILIASVAEALKKTPDLLDQLTIRDVVKFIRHSKGEAAHIIMDASFRPYAIRYWEHSEDGHKTRAQRKTAFIDGNKLMNIAFGPHANCLKQSFTNKELPNNDWLTFFDQLAPYQPGDSRKDVFACVQFLMCHVPDVPEDLQILLAIADCESKSLFETAGCRAILAMATREVRISTRVRLIIAVIEVFDLAFLVFVINEDWFREHFSGIAAYFATGVYFMEFLSLCSAAHGYYLQGLIRRFLRDWHHLLILALYGSLLVPTWISVKNSTVEPIPAYRCALGVVIFIKYMQLLFLACQFRFVGMRILPITSVFFDIGPFLFVMFFCVSSSVTMYYALGIRELVRSFTIVYKLILIGDLRMEEIESVPDAELRVVNQTGYIEQTLPAKTEYHYVVIFVMVFITLSMSLTLMNLFIAILNISYDKAAKTAEVHFLRNNANFVVDAHAIRISHRTLRMFCRRRNDGQSKRPRLSGHSNPDRTGQNQREDSIGFLWLCLGDQKQ